MNKNFSLLCLLAVASLYGMEKEKTVEISDLKMTIEKGDLELIKILLEDPKTEVCHEYVKLAETKFLEATTPAEKEARSEIFKLVEAIKYENMLPNIKPESNNAYTEAGSSLSLIVKK